MSVIFVARPIAAPTPAPVTTADSRSIWLESLDRSVVVPLDDAPIILRPGFLGLDVPPVDVVVVESPGVEGSFLSQTRSLARPVMLPLALVADRQVDLFEARRLLRDVCKVGETLTPEGSFKIVASSSTGIRDLTVVYVSGLEGDETGNPLVDRAALNLLAPDPFARDRVSRSVEFRVSASSLVMVSDDPANAGPRGLASSVVIGEDMPVDVASEVPVHARLDVFGPFDPLQVSASTGLDIRIPSGVPAGSQFTAVLDPRNKSFRLDGQPAAGLIARGSRIGAPFRPGLNMLSVAASGANDDSRIVLSWRGGWRSLW